MIKIFFTGMLQVYFVVINTYFISKGYITGVLICSFIISFIWSFNVKKIAFGSNLIRLLYSSGASIGSLLGYFTAQILI